MATARNNSRTMLQQEEIDAHRMLTQSMNMLNDRIEKTETDFVGHLKKVEDRLDQIVELTKTVAVLQTQTSQQTDQIIEVRTHLREYSGKFDNSISRLHTRLDELTGHQRDRLELHTKEGDIAIKEVKNLAERTDKEFKQWLNRGWGAWAVLILIFGTVNTALWRWQDNMDKERAVVVQSIDKLQKDHLLYEQRHNAIDASLKDTQATTRNLEQTTRNIEDVLIRRAAK